mgnify:CR=1 FL=1
MAKQNRTTLKGYFETGDIPSQAQYADLIDSNFNLSEADSISVTNITASGNISASSTTGNHVLGGDLTIGDDFTFGIHKLTTHASGLFSLISGSTNILSAQGTHITASGDISSSGTVTAANMTTVGRHYFSAFGGSNLFLLKSGDNLLIENGGLIVNSHITASGNISASGNIIGETGSFDNGIILTAPNGNKFRFIVNNSGHLSITGSAV